MKRILFIGNNLSKPNHIQPAIKRGYEIILLKKNPTEKERLIFNQCLDLDPFAIDKILPLVKKLNIDGCITRFEPYIPVLGAICETLNLSGPSLQSCLNARDKFLMRRCFEKNSVPSPKYKKILKPKDFKKINLDFPLLLKPTTGAKSRYIIKVENKKQIKKKYEFCLEKIKKSSNLLFSKLDLFNLKSDILAEEFLRGKQYTTTSFVSNKKIFHLGIADVVSAFDKKINAFYLISRTTPTRLSEEEQKNIFSVSSDGIKALDLDNIPLHPELIYTNEGPKVLEIAARIGGYRSEMEKYSSGIDLDEIALDICLGRKPRIERKFKSAATAVEIWPQKSGKIKKIENLEKIKEIKEIKILKINKGPGDVFKMPPIGTKPIGWFLVQAKTPATSKKLAFDILKELKVVI